MEEEQQHQFIHATLPSDHYDRDNLEYELIVRQEPKQARMCGVGGKADRRPIDPPPIVQLRVIDRSQRRAGSVKEGDDAGSRASSPGHSSSSSFLQNPYYFMFASLAKPDEDVELHWLKDGKTRCTTGSVVSSLYHLKDSENQNEDAGFFVFPDLSVRTEGSYRLKLSLFEVVGSNVYHCKSVFSAPFYVYTAKKFPGMEESTPLSCSLADQGIKIRIRKDIRVRKKTGVSDVPQPIPMPLPVPVPLPMSSSNGNSNSNIPPPVIFPSSSGPPVRLDPIGPDEQDANRERERERNGASERDRDRDGTRDDDRQREKDRDHEREYERDKERRPSTTDRKTNLRRDSASTGLSASERSTKRMRGEDSYGELPEPTLPPQAHQQHPQAGSPVAIAPPPAPIQPSPWSGSLDPALNAAPTSNGPPAPSAPPPPIEHQPPPQHYVPPPGPYDHRYAPAPGPGPSYHYDHAPPPPGHQPPPPQHYGHPPPHYAHPPPPSYAYPPPTQWQGQTQPYQQDPYAHTYAPQAHGLPHPHAPPPHHPPPRYDYANAYQQPQPQAYPGYYEHHPPPPPHGGYPPRSPQPVGYDYPTSVSAAPPAGQTAPPYRPEPARQDSTGGRPATTPSAYPYPVPAAAPPHYASNAYPPPPPGPSSTAPPHYASTSHHPSPHALPPPPSQPRGPPNHYQLSSPGHQGSGGYSGYPVPPPPPSGSAGDNVSPTVGATTATSAAASSAAAAAAGAWGTTFAAPPLHSASWGPVSDGYGGGGGSYGASAGAGANGAQQQQQQQQPPQQQGRIQLAPLRTPPAASGAGERSGGGKKNPLSIGNIISDEN